uniref:Uncharacterized protein n=1 Tax=Solanum tuberosum TaxID=4113 RepID=M1DJ44_SOLTU
MRNIKERMASVEGRLGMEERVNIPSNGVPQSQLNPVCYLSLCKGSHVGKEDPSCGRHGTISTLDTFTIANEQSVNVSLSICELIASLPYADNVLVKSVDTLVDPIDDRIDSSNKIDLCPPSIDTCDLKDSTLINDDFVDQPGEHACFGSSLVVDPSLFKYNILFRDAEITPSNVHSGVNLESNIALDNYTCYSNPLWCEAFPPKDGNLFLEDESTLVGKECDEEKGGVGFRITSSSWCVSILDSITNTFEPIGSPLQEILHFVVPKVATKPHKVATNNI